MGLPYIKMTPEESLALLDKQIVLGYKVKDEINEKYYADPANAQHNVSKWQQLADEWRNQTFAVIADIFISEKEQYNFRDVSLPLGVNQGNEQFGLIKKVMQARILKLNEYDKEIRENFKVNYDIVLGDKITQNGDYGKIRTKK